MYSHENTIEKFNKLYSLVFHNINKVESDHENPYDNDLLWCSRMLKDVKNGIIPPKIDLLSANQIWKKYEKR